MQSKTNISYYLPKKSASICLMSDPMQVAAYNMHWLLYILNCCWVYSFEFLNVCNENCRTKQFISLPNSLTNREVGEIGNCVFTIGLRS